MNRWHVYNYLKSVDGVITKEFYEIFKGIDPVELYEGTWEYDFMAMNNPNYYAQTIHVD